MLKKNLKKIEGWLYARGFHVPEVRAMALNQICMMLGSLPLLALGRDGFDFAAGVFLGTLNFLALARVIQELVYVHRGAVALQVVSFYVRLILTAVAFYALIVLKGAAVGWLLAGVSTVLINILLWGVSQFSGKTSKEA